MIHLAKLLACMAIIVVWASPGVAEGGADWPEGLARVFTNTATLTNENLAAHLGPYVRFDPAPCATARMPSAKSPVPIANALIAYADDNACNSATPLVLMQIYIDSRSAAQVDQLRSAMGALLPSPCFSGEVLPDARRHAPPRSLIAWKQQNRIITWAMEAGNPKSVALSLLISDSASGAGGGATDRGVADRFLASLPLSCH